MADYVRYYVFAMIVLYFGWRVDRAYGLMTHATQKGALLGIHWVFAGTFLGTAALPCIAHSCSRYAALAAGSTVGRDGRKSPRGKGLPCRFCCSCANLVGAVRYRARMVR
jgi:hypothetical protein